MATKTNRHVPARAIHPGEILREELRERRITQNEFAQMTGVPPATLKELIQGKRDVCPDLAIKLEKHLGIPYKTWMSIQNGFAIDAESIAKKNQPSNREHRTT